MYAIRSYYGELRGLGGSTIKQGARNESEIKTASEESCPRLLRRLGYVRDRTVVEGKLRL